MIKVKVIHSIKEISEESWSQLVNHSFVFLNYSFLVALENSGSLGQRTGWFPNFLLAFYNDICIGACPMYLKLNSYGEYIFDWAWADLSERSGRRYYPKLTSAIPFTPATGLKLIIKEGEDCVAVQNALIEKAKEMLPILKASSIHYLFIDSNECETFERNGFMIRHTFQYHWRNKSWKSFDDFLASLKQKRRKEIQRERKSIVEEGIKIDVLSGSDIKTEHAELMNELYLNTISEKYSYDYLTPEFFQEIFETMKDHIVFVVARDATGPFAATLNFREGSSLYGRYWGSFKPHRNLHFELCYYKTIEYAIENGLQLFEAGAQGEHKLSRGFSPTLTYSAHLMKEPVLNEIIEKFVTEEKQSVKDYIDRTSVAYKS